VYYSILRYGLYKLSRGPNTRGGLTLRTRLHRYSMYNDYDAGKVISGFL